MDLEKLTITEVGRIFQMYPGQINQLENRGILPRRGRGKPMTREAIRKLATWREQANREIPAEAMDLIDRLCRGGGE